MIKAEKIVFLAANQTGENSPTSNMLASDFRRGVLDAYNLDIDNKSFSERLIDEEEEERAVAEFVSDFDMNLRAKGKGRAPDDDEDDNYLGEDHNEGENEEYQKKMDDDQDKDGEEFSQQFSIDDVSDDDESAQELLPGEEDDRSCNDGSQTNN